MRQDNIPFSPLGTRAAELQIEFLHRKTRMSSDESDEDFSRAPDMPKSIEELFHGEFSLFFLFGSHRILRVRLWLCSGRSFLLC